MQEPCHPLDHQDHTVFANLKHLALLTHVFVRPLALSCMVGFQNKCQGHFVHGLQQRSVHIKPMAMCFLVGFQNYFAGPFVACKGHVNCLKFLCHGALINCVNIMKTASYHICVKGFCCQNNVSPLDIYLVVSIFSILLYTK